MIWMKIKDYLFLELSYRHNPLANLHENFWSIE